MVIPVAHREAHQPETWLRMPADARGVGGVAHASWADQVLERAHDAIVSADASGRIVFFNAAAERIFGHAAIDVLGRSLDVLIPDHLVARHRNLVAGFGRSTDTARSMRDRREVTGRHADGRSIPLLGSVCRADTAGGHVFTAILSDLSEQRSVEVRAEQLGSALDGSAIALLMCDPGGRVEYANPTFRRLVAGWRAPLLGCRLDEVAPAIARALSSLDAGDPAGRQWKTHLELPVADGADRHLDVWAARLDDGPDGPGLVASFHDVTERCLALHAAGASDRRSRAVLNAMAALSAVVDGDGIVVATNDAWRAFARDHGAPADIGLGVDYLAVADAGALAGAPGAAQAAAGLRAVLAGHLQRTSVDYCCDVVAGDGQPERRWYMMTIEAIDAHAGDDARSGDGRGGAVICHRDISRRKLAEEALRHQALHDALTSLPNRPAILDRIRRAIERTQGSDDVVAVLLLDLDRFKIVNDSLGHGVGDAVLVEAAARITRAVRPGDAVGRLGGDEFLVVCEHLTGPDAGATIARRILDALEAPLTLDGRELHVRGSIGIAITDRASLATADDLVRHADTAMYLAKERGGHRVAFFDDELGRRAHQRLRLELDLRAAIEQRDLHLVYQPQFDLRTGGVVGFEGLARWYHPELGDVSPADFVSIAEESELIVRLGCWALDEACARLASWPRAETRMAVNVSARQLTSYHLVHDVAAALDRHGLCPERLELEITETAFVGPLEEYAEALHRLADLGVRIALDDFGTGYASLRHISQLPIHSLKIDRSFIRGLATQAPGARAIVTSILAIAKEFRLDVVAEGIEDEGQLDLLRRLGCPVGQGYLLGRPVADPVLSGGRPWPR